MNIAEQGTHKTTGKYPGSCTNKCSGCGYDYKGNVRPAQIAVHECKEE